LSRFARHLQQRGFSVIPVDLTTMATIPDNAQMVLITQPQLPLFPGEAQALVHYVQQGGALLWLLDPGSLQGLDPVAKALGIRSLPGQVVDTQARELGADHPALALVTQWPTEPFGHALSQPGQFPSARALLPELNSDWHLLAQLQTGANSWNETGILQGTIQADAQQNEQRGPLTIGLAATRSHPGDIHSTAATNSSSKQRLIIVGDSDWLTNAYLDQGANLELGLRMVRWLTGQDYLINTTSAQHSIASVSMSPRTAFIIALVIGLLMPGSLLGIAFLRYRQRHHG
jgi:hypothetical protein